MNIKNENTQRLAHELAALTGESMTVAVTVAIRERLDRLQASGDDARQRAERILAIGREIAPRLSGPFATADHGDLLYDERGLPA